MEQLAALEKLIKCKLNVALIKMLTVLLNMKCIEEFKFCMVTVVSLEISVRIPRIDVVWNTLKCNINFIRVVYQYNYWYFNTCIMTHTPSLYRCEGS